MYHDEHAIAEINQITDTMKDPKVGNRPQTPDKDLQNKTNKNYTFGATTGSVANLATQQKNVKTTLPWKFKIKHIMVQPTYKQ